VIARLLSLRTCLWQWVPYRPHLPTTTAGGMTRSRNRTWTVFDDADTDSPPMGDLPTACPYGGRLPHYTCRWGGTPGGTTYVVAATVTSSPPERFVRATFTRGCLYPTTQQWRWFTTPPSTGGRRSQGGLHHWAFSRRSSPFTLRRRWDSCHTFPVCDRRWPFDTGGDISPRSL